MYLDMGSETLCLKCRGLKLREPTVHIYIYIDRERERYITVLVPMSKHLTLVLASTYRHRCLASLVCYSQAVMFFLPVSNYSVLPRWVLTISSWKARSGEPKSRNHRRPQPRNATRSFQVPRGWTNFSGSSFRKPIVPTFSVGGSRGRRRSRGSCNPPRSLPTIVHMLLLLTVGWI